jgi:excisionase family DNA binding protein
MDKEFMTFAEIAELLGVAPRSVHRWAAEGRFVTYKPGKERLVKRADFDAFIESTREAPGRRGTRPGRKAAPEDEQT